MRILFIKLFHFGIVYNPFLPLFSLIRLLLAFRQIFPHYACHAYSLWLCQFWLLLLYLWDNYFGKQEICRSWLFWLLDFKHI